MEATQRAARRERSDESLTLRPNAKGGETGLVAFPLRAAIGQLGDTFKARLGKLISKPCPEFSSRAARKLSDCDHVSGHGRPIFPFPVDRPSSQAGRLPQEQVADPGKLQGSQHDSGRVADLQRPAIVAGAGRPVEQLDAAGVQEGQL